MVTTVCHGSWDGILENRWPVYWPAESLWSYHHYSMFANLIDRNNETSHLVQGTMLEVMSLLNSHRLWDWHVFVFCSWLIPKAVFFFTPCIYSGVPKESKCAPGLKEKLWHCSNMGTNFLHKEILVSLCIITSLSQGLRNSSVLDSVNCSSNKVLRTQWPMPTVHIRWIRAPLLVSMNMHT